ncbi:TAXI family TRAP transporter solute-binding subunit [Oceanicola sp. 502str15]|uniref:TAXI family TRAP transporter solute-binding subunit n=1 Tax=Oceanicola sp. 502str15 TaxID=2696061 RepID=UPI002095072F|nr:TAXI family TRAP transporter solute-binding subunit [Oceanicola sp. 502str15]MCO6381646.1 TAXI family TRAP transporter solute-binding subunit [Oceanicola sp. 502str15]
MLKRATNLLAGAALAIGLTTASATAQDYTWPDYFSVVTPIVGTANHSLAVAWTAEFSAQTASRARVLPAPNGYARAEWLNTGEGLVAMVQASDYFDIMDANEGYATPTSGPADSRVAVMNMITPWGYMVRGDSDIQSFADIGPGTRIAFSPSSSFLVAGVDALLAYRGLTRDDVELVEVGNYGANTRITVEGRADVTFTSPLSGTSYEAEANPQGIRWLPLPKREDDPEAFARYRAIQPGYVPSEITSGVPSSQGLYMDHAYQANHVLADGDEEFVYQLAKWLDEHHGDFEKDFTHAKMMSMASLESFLNVGALQPIHAGAIRYLKEKGVWTDAHQARQDALVELAEARVALWQETLAEAEEKGIDVSPDSAEFAELWTAKRDAASGGKTYGELVLSIE